MDDTQELLPCPFCGADQETGPIHVCREPEGYTVQCDQCSATMGWSESEDEAITEWNTRAAPTLAEAMRCPEMAAVREALRFADTALHNLNPFSGLDRELCDYAAIRTRADIALLQKDAKQ